VFWLLSAHTAQRSGWEKEIRGTERESRGYDAQPPSARAVPQGTCHSRLASGLFAVLRPEIVLRRVSAMAFCAQLASLRRGEASNSKTSCNVYILDRVSRGTKKRRQRCCQRLASQGPRRPPHLLIEMTLSFSSSNRDASIEGPGSQCPRGWSGDSEVQLCVGERSMSKCDRYARTYHNSSVCDVRKCHRKPAATVNMSACLLLPTIQIQ
jgi:hypothetical protein